MIDDDVATINNIAFGERTTLNELYNLIQAHIAPFHPAVLKKNKPHYRDFRAGDVHHSLADVSKLQIVLVIIRIFG